MKTVTKKVRRESFQVKDSSEDINDKDIEKEKEESLKAIREACQKQQEEFVKKQRVVRKNFEESFRKSRKGHREQRKGGFVGTFDDTEVECKEDPQVEALSSLVEKL